MLQKSIVGQARAIQVLETAPALLELDDKLTVSEVWAKELGAAEERAGVAGGGAPPAGRLRVQVRFAWASPTAADKPTLVVGACAVRGDSRAREEELRR